jgi:DNA adenine methylase
MGALKPPVAYFGGKTTLAPRIANLLPPHEHYVEPYCGSLSVLLAKAPSTHETVNDLNGDLVTFWRVLRDRPDELIRAYLLTPHSRAEQLEAYDRNGCDDLERARRVWVTLTQGRAGTFKRTGWRHYQAGKVSSFAMPGYLVGYAKRANEAAARLAHVSLECLPALDLIERYGRHDDVLLYVDPPYLGSTRSRSWDGYADQEMRGESDHRDLGKALRGCTAAVVISGYPSALYDLELFPDWHRRTFSASTGQGGTWDNRTEVLWSNRPFGIQPPLDGMLIG